MAMDEVSFDFMEARAPGCVALFPSSTDQVSGRLTNSSSGTVWTSDDLFSVVLR